MFRDIPQYTLTTIAWNEYANVDVMTEKLERKKREGEGGRRKDGWEGRETERESGKCMYLERSLLCWILNFLTKKSDFVASQKDNLLW